MAAAATSSASGMGRHRAEGHGYGPVLLAGAEMYRMMNNDKIKINSSPTSSVIYVPAGDSEESK